MTSYRPLWSVQLVKDRSVPYESRPLLDSPLAVVSAFNMLFGAPACEHMMAFYCDQRHRLLGAVQVGQGTGDRCPVDVAGIARAALLSGSSGVMLVHNHPSGDLNASPEDREVTKRVKDGLGLLGIELVDHVIVGDGQFISMREKSALW
jgi:DNA repair protein RadC